VERGFAPGQTVVTVVGIAGTVEVVHGANSEAEEILLTLAHSLTIAGNAGGAGLLGGGEPLVALSYEHAQALAAAGLSKAAVKGFLFKHARLPLSRLGAGVAAGIRAHRPSGHTSGEDDALRVARRPDDIMIVVAGGIGIKSTYLPTWGGGTLAQSAVVEAHASRR